MMHLARPALMRALIAALAVAFLHATGAVADTRFGLDQRPVNATCLAPALPAQGTGAKVVAAFQNLSFVNPVSMQQQPGTPPRWFVAERAGQIRTFTNNYAAGTTMALDLGAYMQFTSLTDLSDSQQAGITAIALHPDFSENGYLYIAYNRKPSATSPVVSTLSRFTARANRASFDPKSEKVLLTLTQATPWHHIGHVMFGPDRYLYVGLGDGANILPDPRAFRAQDPKSLWGKILRIDVNNGNPYAIPPTNPYANGVNGAPEVWARGFRNPWRFTFDRETGLMWASDVGQSTWEEIDRVNQGGNYGWPYFEGPRCTQATCNQTGLTAPVYAFQHSDAAAVTGGYVYRGTAIPSLQGVYVFGGISSTTIWGLDPAKAFARRDVALFPNGAGPSGFFEDAAGELYMLNGQRTGPVYTLVPDGVIAGTAVASRLSQTGCVDPDNPKQFAAGVIPYDVNMPLWTDGAEKHRGMALPNGGTVSVGDDGDFDFPDRTVLVKTFLLDGKPVETRLFMRHPGGVWQGYSYEWRADRSDADLLPAGKTKTITRADGTTQKWVYPSRSECLVCHGSATGFAIGPEMAQINRDIAFPATGRTSNQIDTWAHIGLFAGAVAPAAQQPSLAGRTESWTSEIRRARSYLHANCAFCHRPGGNAQSSLDFRYSRTMAQMNACNRPPLSSNLGIAGAKLLTPGAPNLSLLWQRMTRRDGMGMPPLGSQKVDGMMAKQVASWIARADVCNNPPDFDGDGVPNNVDNCVRRFNPDQADDNHDGYGNRCDGDFNGDLATNVLDRNGLRNKAAQQQRKNDPLFTSQHDLNRDQIIDAKDLAIFDSELAGHPPGPSALRP